MTGRTGGLADLVADRPLGPVFESLFDLYGLRVHLSVVRGGAELLDLGRDRATELMDRWLGDQEGAGALSPETLLLQAISGAVTRATLSDPMRRLAPALTADLVARDLVEDGALGASVRVGDDAAFVGVPPRTEGWRVQVPGEHERPHLMLVGEGGVSARPLTSGWITISADRAWRAAAEAERLAQTEAGSSTNRSAPA